MKKSFTLVEVIISITLFAIIVLFLYETLDGTKKSNQFFNDKLVQKQDTNSIKKILFMDFIHELDDGSIKIDKDNTNININI